MVAIWQSISGVHRWDNQSEYQWQYDEYEARYHETQRRFAEVEALRVGLTACVGWVRI